MDKSLILMICFVDVIGVFTQEVCDGCDCTISDATDVPPRIKAARITCHEGSVTWYNPIGALRLEVSPMATKAFQLCFVMESGDAGIKLSQELDQKINAKVPSDRKKYVLNDGNHGNLKTVAVTPGLVREHCISSAKPIFLYLEPEHSERLGYQKVFFQYDVTPLAEVKEPSIEDCQPCSEAEILRAYCSSDFVVVGSMNSVTHLDDVDKTHVEIAVSQIIRQRGIHFHRRRRDSTTLQGIIAAPRRCGIIKGDGLFLMTGRVRFGELRLGCAPYLHEWEAMAQAAELTGRMECSRD